MEDAFLHNPNYLNYHFMCESKSLRRGRNFTVVAMSVDPSTELGITVATSDGRLQVVCFLILPQSVNFRPISAPSLS